MQKNVFTAIGLCGGGFSMKGQGDNTRLRYTSNKTQGLDENKRVQYTRDEKVMVEVTKTAISIIPATQAGETLTGSFTDVSCLWKEAFNAGKTVISTRLCDKRGAGTPATITIEAADGKITILLEAAHNPGCNMRLLVDRHEEMN